MLRTKQTYVTNQLIGSFRREYALARASTCSVGDRAEYIEQMCQQQVYLVTNMPGHKRHKSFVCEQVLAQNLSKNVRVVLCIVHIPNKLVVKSLGPQTDVQPAFKAVLRAFP